MHKHIRRQQQQNQLSWIISEKKTLNNWIKSKQIRRDLPIFSSKIMQSHKVMCLNQKKINQLNYSIYSMKLYNLRQIKKKTRHYLHRQCAIQFIQYFNLNYFKLLQCALVYLTSKIKEQKKNKHGTPIRLKI